MNKKIEKHFLNEYLLKCLYGNFVIGNSEKPDFIVSYGKNKIGIEVTQLYRSIDDKVYSFQSQRKLQDIVVKISKEIYCKNNINNHYVSFCFNEKSRIDNKNKYELAEYFANLIESKICTNKDRNQISIYQSELKYPEHIFMIQILDFRKYNTFEWEVNNVFSVDLMDINNLKTRISEKELKFNTYQKFDQNWLFIFVDFWNHSSDQEMFSNNDVKISSSNFDKIILFKNVLQKSIILYEKAVHK